MKDNIKAALCRQPEYKTMAESPRPGTWSANHAPWPGYLERGGENDADQKAGHETE